MKALVCVQFQRSGHRTIASNAVSTSPAHTDDGRAREFVAEIIQYTLEYYSYHHKETRL